MPPPHALPENISRWGAWISWLGTSGERTLALDEVSDGTRVPDVLLKIFLSFPLKSWTREIQGGRSV